MHRPRFQKVTKMMSDQGRELQCSTMMDVPLSVGSIAEGAESLFGATTLIGRTATGQVATTYGDFVARVRRLASGLTDLGVRPGDRVASYAWNTLDHLALYFAVPAIGAVLHTVNIRLSAEDVLYIVGDAGDEVLFVDDALAGSLPDVRQAGVRTLVRMGGDSPATPGAVSFSDLVAQGDPGFEFVSVPEESAAVLCYTSGTTGRPKGVAYSHRSICLNALSANQPDAFGIRESDIVMPLVPMFHANAWNFPFIAAMAGAGLVLPGPAPTPQIIIDLVAEHRVTLSAAVPTVWQGVLDTASPTDLRSVRELIGGGSAVPESMIRAFDDRFGIPLVQGWGMTETSPLAAISRESGVADTDTESAYARRARQGRLIPFVHARLDATAGGELQLRGPTITGSYYRGVSPDSFTEDGWLRTGDIAEVDDRGYIKLVDRTKDLVKSGGEWISSVELENAALFHPAISEAAVVAQPDPKWGERPCLFAVLTPGAAVSEEDIKDFLAQRFPRWWVPDSVLLVDAIPKTSVGKIDKKSLRTTVSSLPVE